MAVDKVDMGGVMVVAVVGVAVPVDFETGDSVEEDPVPSCTHHGGWGIGCCVGLPDPFRLSMGPAVVEA